MVKSVLKEIVIILLLIAAIVILLGVLFYDYIPDNKTIPAKVEKYQLASEVNEELEKELKSIETDEIIKTYQLDAIDLEYYEKTKEYNKGKVNPFSQHGVQTPTGSSSSGNSSGNGNSSSGGSSSSGNTGSNGSSSGGSGNTSSSSGDSSSGTFLNTNGKK